MANNSIYDFFKKLKGKNKKSDFRSKVEEAMIREDDFRALYDIGAIENLDEDDKRDYLQDILKDYLKVKSELLKEKEIRKIG